MEARGRGGGRGARARHRGTRGARGAAHRLDRCGYGALRGEAARRLSRGSEGRRGGGAHRVDHAVGTVAGHGPGTARLPLAARPDGRGPGRGAERARSAAAAGPDGAAQGRWLARNRLAHAMKARATNASFAPAPWLANRHLQTLYSALLAPAPTVTFRRERWDTPDGDFVDMDFVDGVAGSPW